MGSIRIGTRGSALALWQAERVAALLRARHPALDVSIVTIESHGDRDTRSVSALGLAGIFTREIEQALLRNTVDLAVHSLKDLPTESPQGLEIAAFLPRDDPRDVLVAPALAERGLADGDGAAALAALPQGARIATSSLRRRAELLRARRDLQVVEMRGNVPTRLDKVERGEVDGIVLSSAGLVRLGLEPRGRVVLDTETMLPAPAQGTIAVQARGDDGASCEIALAIDDRHTRLCTGAERLLLHALEGGCRVPLGALAHLDGDTLTLRARLQSADGTEVLDETAAANVHTTADLVHRMAQTFRTRGAARILAALRDL